VRVTEAHSCPHLRSISLSPTLRKTDLLRHFITYLAISHSHLICLTTIILESHRTAASPSYTQSFSGKPANSHRGERPYADLFRRAEPLLTSGALVDLGLSSAPADLTRLPYELVPAGQPYLLGMPLEISKRIFDIASAGCESLPNKSLTAADWFEEKPPKPPLLPLLQICRQFHAEWAPRIMNTRSIRGPATTAIAKLSAIPLRHALFIRKIDCDLRLNEFCWENCEDCGSSAEWVAFSIGRRLSMLAFA
jgi:hypothetical protein